MRALAFSMPGPCDRALCLCGTAVQGACCAGRTGRGRAAGRTTEDWSCSRRRRRQGRRARRRAEGSRGAARPDRLHRRHQHGCADRRGIRVGPAGGGDGDLHHGYRLGICGRRRRPPVLEPVEQKRLDGCREHTSRAGLSAWPHRHTWRAGQHQRHRRPASQPMWRAHAWCRISTSCPYPSGPWRPTWSRARWSSSRAATSPRPCARAWRYRELSHR